MGFSHHRSLPYYALQLFFLIFSCFFIFTAAIDTIRANESLNGSDALISNGSRFKLSNFSPPNSRRRYVGIMFNLPVMTVVWVANRNKPLNDSTATLEMSSDGNLVILDGQKEIVWSTNLSTPVANTSAVLLDTGNLVLQDNSNNDYVWESFNHASDSWLEKMRIFSDLNRNERNMLTSWRSDDDPAPGSFTLTIEPLDLPQLFAWKDGEPFWRDGPAVKRDYGNNGVIVGGDSPRIAYTTFTLGNSSTLEYYVLNYSGDIEHKKWSDEKKGWEVTWSSRSNKCDLYGRCGPFGRCNAQEMPICSCFHGFMPKNNDEWKAGNWTGGCTRKTILGCEEDVFLRVEKLKFPDHFKREPSFDQDCRGGCLSNCSCIAYSYSNGYGCLLWTRNLIDAQEFSTNIGDDLYIRLAFSEFSSSLYSLNLLLISMNLYCLRSFICLRLFSAQKKQDRRTIIATTVVLGFILVTVCALLLIYRARKHRNRLISSKIKRPNVEFSEESVLMNGVKLEELPLFKFQMLSSATENFDPVNKLGQGGFGSVYRGKFPNGKEIAVKRLARSSNQGVEEFMNEVEVISRLQHRNLVRLLGCCIESEEKMLVYEYMPNGSLDAYLFCSHKREFLDWPKRKLIIEGICRGLLYLHRDSRLKIIHRDLKASNILLDEKLIPKISDFGMARIFGGNCDQANTNRVVGTYGYMSPEYALRGIFSEKSDVYSFGVLLLDIVSGKKNSSFYEEDEHLFLMAYAWKLWNDRKIISLMDAEIYDGGMEDDFRRYANVGLLCVQEEAADRPNISTVLSMLSCEIVELPHPKQPAFLGMKMTPRTEPSTQSSGKGSVNDVTVSIVEGR